MVFTFKDGQVIGLRPAQQISMNSIKIEPFVFWRFYMNSIDFWFSILIYLSVNRIDAISKNENISFN